MSRASRRVLSPHHQNGSSIPSMSSTATSPAWLSSSIAYPPSNSSNDQAQLMAWRYGPPTLAKVVRSPGSIKSNHGRIYKRSKSNSSLKNSLSAFPVFDDQESIASPSLAAQKESLYQRDIDVEAQSKVKIKPFLRKISSRERGNLDLTKSAAENEVLSMRSNSFSMGGGGSVAHRGSSSSDGRRIYHARTSSAISAVSSTTTSSLHRGASQYVHPMRQNPQSYTPPIPISLQNSRRASVDDDAASVALPQSGLSESFSTGSVPHQYAPLPSTSRTRPSLQVNTHASTPRLNSSQSNLNLPGTPSSLRQAETTSPDDMHLRRSLEKAMGVRSVRDLPEETQIAIYRAEFNAKEAKKDRLAQEKETKRLDKEHEKLHRIRTRARERASSNASSNIDQLAGLDLNSAWERQYATYLSNKSRSSAEKAESEKSPLDNVPYGQGFPRKRSLPIRAMKAMRSQWQLFSFHSKTVWIKIRRSFGVKRN